MAMTLPGGLLDKLRSPEGQKLFRYSVASLVAVAISVGCLLLFVGVIDMGAVPASILSTCIAAVPNYYMNRKWAWGKDGKSHLWREVVPFWVLAFIGLACSTLSVKWMENYAKHHHFSHLDKTASVGIVYIGAFGVLWVAKFVIFNKILFVHHLEDLPEALDGREISL